MAINSLSDLLPLINSLKMSLENLLEIQLKAIAVFQETLSGNSSKKHDKNLSKVYSFICFSGDLMSESIEANKRLLNVLRKEIK
jgi:hypothetical protein